MRFPLIIITTCGVIALALAVGVLRPGLSSATLQRHAERSVAGCMAHAGFDPAGPLTIELAWSPRDRALQRCWSHAAKDPRFERLALVDPIADAKKRRAEGFEAWRCAERSGYVRTTRIPLSGPDGYPLQLAAGNFRVGSSDARPRALLSRRGEVQPANRSRPTDGRTGSSRPTPPTASAASATPTRAAASTRTAVTALTPTQTPQPDRSDHDQNDRSAMVAPGRPVRPRLSQR